MKRSAILFARIGAMLLAVAGSVYSGSALPDADNDGMPDDWEEKYFGTPTAGDPDLDQDGDSLTNLEEYRNSTDPFERDTDGDSLMDGWEVAYGFDPVSVLAISSPTSAVGSASFTGGKNVVVDGNYAYVAAGSGGLIAVDVSAPASPLVVESFTTGITDARDVVVSNGIAYVADLFGGLVTVDVSDMTDLHKVGGVDPSDGYAMGIALNGSDVYLPQGDHGLSVIDASTPSTLREIYSETGSLRKMYDVFVSGGSVYVAAQQNILRYSIGTSPELILSDTAAALNRDMGSIHGNGTLVAVGGLQGVQIFNDDSLSSGNALGDGYNCQANGVFVSDGLLYVANHNGLEVLDISDPSNLRLIITQPTEGVAQGVFVSGAYTYVITDQGLEIFDLVPDSDSDGDGMPDGWEVDNRLDPLIDDSALDADSDGLTNLQEYQNGTDPNRADSDGDGMPDGEEVSLGTNPLSPYDPVYVDANARGDPKAGDPAISDPDEDGTSAHPFDSIQKAIDSTKTLSGATILVASRTAEESKDDEDNIYKGAGNYDINPGEKELRIISTGGSSLTTIQTHGYGSAFVVEQGQTKTLIQGFTIETFGDLAPEEGIVVNGSSPTLSDLVIHNCELEAVSCLNGAAPLITNSVFFDVLNGVKASGSGGVRLLDCVISNTTDYGVSIANDDLAEITDCIIENCAGGVLLNSSDAQIDRCVIQNNRTDANGGGIQMVSGSSPLLINTLIAQNSSAALGGGLYISADCNPTGINCTVADNVAASGGGISSAGRPFFRNMIFWGNRATEDPNIGVVDEVVNVWHSVIEYGHSNSVYSTTDDPLFVGAADYHLASTNSSAFDAGTYESAPLVDLDGNPRRTHLSLRVDIGCYEFIDSDAFRITYDQRLTDGAAMIAWKSQPGCTYTVQFTDSLLSAWTDLAEVSGTGDPIVYEDTRQGEGARFYRVLVRTP